VGPGTSLVRLLELTAPPNASGPRKVLSAPHAVPREFYRSSATVSRFRPLARRRFNTMRPFFVDILTKNPWALARRRVFG
jgi:hypothetical protein